MACGFCGVLLMGLLIPAKFILTGDMQLILIVVTLIFVGVLCLFLIKSAKDAKCPNCEVDLFNVIDAAVMRKIEVHYCPSCGANIEI